MAITRILGKGSETGGKEACRLQNVDSSKKRLATLNRCPYEEKYKIMARKRAEGGG